LAAFVSPCVTRTSGSRPRFPISITLFRLLTFLTFLGFPQPDWTSASERALLSGVGRGESFPTQRPPGSS
jgi:hypothetical protein